MYQKSIARRLRKQSATLIIAGSLVLVGLAAYNYRSDDLSSNATLSSAASSRSSVADPKPKTPTSSGNEPTKAENTPNPTAADPPALITGPQSAAQNQAEPASCSLDIGSRVNDYYREINQDKSNLDRTIGSPPVGVNLLRRYVDKFNQDSVRLYEQYRDEFAKANCVFPVSSSEQLPRTYPY